MRATRLLAHDNDFRTQGQAFLSRLESRYRLDPGIRDLLEAWFGLGPWLAGPLPSYDDLRRIKCLHPGRRSQPTFAAVILWAYADPSARYFIHPDFYVER